MTFFSINSRYDLTTSLFFAKSRVLEINVMKPVSMSKLILE